MENDEGKNMFESIASYGIYSGPGCVSKIGGNDDGNPFVSSGYAEVYDFGEKPIND